ncbi:SET domain-containing protein [Candidatus Uhrbacteria bacterium]|nr:SET domain-containing protein [Candidatus Uhrbacteria bacterium]
MPEGVKEMVRDFCVTEDGAYLIPTQTLNLLNISFFVNHSSEAPNLEAREEKGDMTFYTLRDIKEGEELLVDYRTYSDDWK